MKDSEEAISETTISVNVTAPEGMVLVEGGTFMMGSNQGYSNEKPVHEVSVDSFYISRHEVTNAEYCEFLNAKGTTTGVYEGNTVTWVYLYDNNNYCGIEKVGNEFKPKEGKENHPVVCVTWYGANAYAEWVGGRLPTEAEWEYAARGGKQSHGYEYSGSNSIDDVVWYDGNSGSRIHAVGGKQSNELGLHDMSGNVWEWCSDWYGSYSGEPQDNPTGPTSGYYRVLRGGSWGNSAPDSRVVYRSYSYPNGSGISVGFRCVRPLN